MYMLGPIRRLQQLTLLQKISNDYVNEEFFVVKWYEVAFFLSIFSESVIFVI